MNLKYADAIGRIENCPPNDVSPIVGLSYRFVHADIKDSRNFLPVAMLSPKRTFKTSKDQCSAYGLSMFASEIQAREFYKKLRAIHKKIRDTLGTHVACGSLGQDEGISTEPESDGHFNFFEAEGLSLVERFVIVGEDCDA